MPHTDRTYSFVFRGLLTQEALDRIQLNPETEAETDNVEFLLGVDALDERFVAEARRVAQVYTMIAAFENSVRELISATLREEVGEDWWEKCVSEKIRNQAQQRIAEEEKVKWHTPRGNDQINFTMLPNLINIIRQNHSHFSAPIPDLDWAENVFEVIERSRNVIMHSGRITRRDMGRLGTFVRDWASQVYS